MNKSQAWIIETIVTGMLGIPDVNEIFTEEIIKVAQNNIDPLMIFVVSLLKILLVFSSIFGFYQLTTYIQFTYDRHRRTFDIYILKLIITAGITFFIMLYVTKGQNVF